MKNTYYITQREVYAYFASPIAYVIMAVFLVFSGIFFYSYAIDVQEANQIMRSWFSLVGFFMLFFGSIITTRLIAEEQRTGTLELLFTSPVRNWEVVLGKWLASMALFGVALLFTFYYLLILIILGGKVDLGPLVSGYLGLLLEAGVFSSIGLFASALAFNQVIAAVLSLVFSLILYILGPLVVRSGTTDWIGNTLNFITLQTHMQGFAQGVLDLRDIIFFLSLITLFLYGTGQSISTRRAA
ncbi:ABC transporter permease [Candidatus Chlorohelix sp.]|uniref:ABC transporter permease n=1 Tax=Candidatus Chlorohelix sp. TaxID=3139201 RepID=UPI0030434888